MSTNVMVRDMDVPSVGVGDSRRLEIVVDGLSLINGSQLVIDTTLVSPLRRDGSGRPGAATRNGVAPHFARKDKERTHPELTGQYGRCRLVVFGGRWLAETGQFLAALARARAQSAPRFFRAKAARAWMMWWKGILACTAARAFAVSLLEKRPFPGVSAELPSVHEVVREERLHVQELFVWLTVD